MPIEWANQSEKTILVFYYLCAVKRITITIVTLLLWIASFAQTRKIDSTLVTFYPTSLDSITLNSPHCLDTTTFHANNFDILSRHQTVYSTLSNVGTAHKSMRFRMSPQIGFDMEVPGFDQYIKTNKDLKTYLALLPYSEIRYVMTFGDKEQHLNFKFGRQFEQGLFLSFEYNINYAPANYTNNKVENNYFWVNALYTTEDQRYRAFAYWFRNKIDVQENGGIIHDSIYSNHLESDNSAILTNLSSATNYVKVSGIGFQHYFNLLPQYKTIIEEIPDSLAVQPMDSLEIQPADSLLFQPTDSLSFQPIDSLRIDSLSPDIKEDSVIVKTREVVVERTFTLGRVNHSFAYQRNQLFYNETSASLPFYAPFDTLLSSKTTDTTMVYAFRNSLTWNSLGYQSYSNNVPFYVYAGIDYDYFKHKHYDYYEELSVNDQNHSQVSLHGGVIINLFKSTTLSGQAKLITLGYQIGDFDVKAKWRQYLGTNERNYGKLSVDFDMRRQSPTWFETSYQSNHFRWDNDFHAATYLILDANYQYKWFNAGLRQTTVNDLIYFNQKAQPSQHDGITSISEIYGNAKLSLWKFKIEGFLTLQKANNEDIVHLPLLLAKLKVGFEQPVFKNAAILQPSLTVQYFTKYHADAYMPALRTFYLQDEVLIGNYPYIDLALAINVKQADIYLQYSNMFLLTGNYDSFIAPHYPMRDSKIFIGINWRLFN